MRGKQCCCDLRGPEARVIQTSVMSHLDISDKDEMLKSCPLTFKVSEGPDSLTSLDSFSASPILYTFTMLMLLSVLLLSSHVPPLVQSLNCDERTEYNESNKCCKKCAPGLYMQQRCTPGSDTGCMKCGNGYYTDQYNVNYKKCNPCTMCTKEHMKYEKNCTVTNDAVCTCEDGYRCSDSKCQTCVEVQTSTPGPTKQAPTTDNVWISVSLCFACVCACVLFTCFLLISRHTQPCKRIMSASTGLWSPQKRDSRSSQCTEEEEVPMPVQEVCGKTEKLEEV